MTLLLVMRHGFFTDKLVESRAMLPGLVRMNHQARLFVEIGLNLNHYFVFSLIQVVLFLFIKLIKGTPSTTTIISTIVSNLLSMKYEGKQNHRAQSASDCFMIMVVLILIPMLLTI